MRGRLRTCETCLKFTWDMAKRCTIFFFFFWKIVSQTQTALTCWKTGKAHRESSRTNGFFLLLLSSCFYHLQFSVNKRLLGPFILNLVLTCYPHFIQDAEKPGIYVWDTLCLPAGWVWELLWTWKYWKLCPNPECAFPTYLRSTKQELLGSASSSHGPRSFQQRSQEFWP